MKSEGSGNGRMWERVTHMREKPKKGNMLKTDVNKDRKTERKEGETDGERCTPDGWRTVGTCVRVCN